MTRYTRATHLWPHTYDREGKPITLSEWSFLKEDHSYVIIGKTEVHGCTVSTVWLGLDHGHGTSPHPIIFETMIFVPEGSISLPGVGPISCELIGNAISERTWRYETVRAARQGHNHTVVWLSGLLKGHLDGV